MELRQPGTLLSEKVNEVAITNVKSRIVFTGKIIEVGDAQGLNGSFSNSAKKVPQEDINPHGGAGVHCTFLKGKKKKKGKQTRRLK